MVDCLDEFASALALSRHMVKTDGGWDLSNLVWKGVSSMAKLGSWRPELPQVDLGLTRLEVSLIGAGLCYGAYKVHSSQVLSKLDWHKLKLKLGYKPKIVPKPQNCIETTMHLECLRPGSLEVDLIAPKCQCIVGDMVDGKFEVHGSAVLMGRVNYWYLVMPEHVWVATKTTWARGRQHQVDLSYKKDTEDVLELVTDLLAIRITDKEMSTIGISSASIMQYLPEGGVEAKVVGCYGRGTIGALKHDASVFGRVTYAGSTQSGYSGAAYTVNGQIVGVHSYGSKTINGGWNGSFAWMILNHKIRGLEGTSMEKFETWEWLQNSLKGKRRIRVDQSWMDLDEVRIQVDGRYAIVDRGSMAQAFGHDWRDSIDRSGSLEFANALGYEDREPIMESGELKNSTCPGGSSLSTEARELANHVAQESIQELLKLSKAQLQQVKAVAKSQPSPVPSSSTQESRLSSLVRNSTV
uniref:Uncharacterized protein n=1 Tax=Solemoviridae sp. TaxID=2715208 RepID=A0A6M3YSA2_9VIRU|nr:MAG: hypothetical protein 1 [Solemoviridae sp.]